jgi:hypothetical protein
MQPLQQFDSSKWRLVAGKTFLPCDDTAISGLRANY